MWLTEYTSYSNPDIWFFKLLLSTELDELSSLIASVTSTLCDTVDSIIGDSSYVLQSLAIGFLDLLLQLYKLIHKIYGKQREDIVQLEDIVQSVHIMRSKIVGFLIKNEAICLPESLTNIDVTFTNRRNLIKQKKKIEFSLISILAFSYLHPVWTGEIRLPSS